MAEFDFCGPTYQSSNIDSDAQWCMNRYPERDEGTGGKTAWILQPCPGLRTFAKLPITSVTSGFEFQIGATERDFSVGSDGVLYELLSDGSFVNRGSVAASATPGKIFNNQTQLLVLAGGKLYRYTLGSNSLSIALTYSDASPIPPIADIGYLDGYFIATIAQTNKFQISSILDANTWDTGNIAQVLYFPDNIVSMKVDHGNIVFLGHKTSVSYYNTGNADFPFAPLPASRMEHGSKSVLGAVQLDNTVYWLGRDERGSLIANKLNGYTPARVSTHAIEQAWQGYATTSDAISYSFQIGGHTFWHIYFPTANKSWRFDAATQLWHEVGFWDNTKGVFTAHRSQCHWEGFGKHLVGDWNSGQIFEMSPTIYNDFGNPMRRVRRSPYIVRENAWMFGNSLEFSCNTGFAIPVTPSTRRQFITLQAPDMNFWSVTMDDSGGLTSSPVASGSVDTIYLNDEGNADNSWLLGVDINGSILANAVPFNAAVPIILPMATTPSRLEGKMTVTHAGTVLGLLETLLPHAVTLEPKLMVRFSRDAAHTWSNERELSLGKIGEYGKRVQTFCLGAWWGTKGLIVEAADSDSYPISITNAFIDADPEMKSTERLSNQMRKGA